MQFRIFYHFAGILLFTIKSFGQTCSSINPAWLADIASPCSTMTMTMLQDRNNLPYLYVANKEAGFKIYNISAISSPVLSATIPTTQFDTLDVMNLHQDGNYLYLALGNHFTNPQKAGMAIIDVSNPAAPSVTDYYVVPGSASGAGIIKTEGNFAYLGAMQSGLVILDITSKNNILLLSQFYPDMTFPPVPNPDSAKYNCRGMEVKNDIVYLCYDAGGFRIINCTNKLAPVETGRYCNPAMYTPFDHPKAYNNCILNDTLIYVTVDYAGLEVLNIKDTANISLSGWWNPYNAPNSNWFTSPSHTNEIKYDANCRRVFISSGKSDMMVVDVTNPFLPDSCNYYGGVGNSLGTWGIDIYQSNIYLSYICVPWPYVPFFSNWTGVKILSYNSCSPGFSEAYFSSLEIFPNPVKDKLNIKGDYEFLQVKILDVTGKILWETNDINNSINEIDISFLKAGMYFVYISDAGKNSTCKKIMKY